MEGFFIFSSRIECFYTHLFWGHVFFSGISAAGSALASGVRGRRFESAIPDFFCLLNNNKIFIFFNFFSENIDDVQKGFFVFRCLFGQVIGEPP